jgi:hypothetical protein
MESGMNDLEEVFRQIQETPAFFDRGLPDDQGKLAWPVIVVFCPRGHDIAAIQLKLDEAVSRWTMESDTRSQSRAGHIGSHRDPRTGNVSLIRTTFSCEQCLKKTGRSLNAPVIGTRLVLLYAGAVAQRKLSFRLT